MSEEVPYKKGANRKRDAEAFESGRKFHVGIGIITLFASMAMLLYIISCTSGILTSTSVDPALILMPGQWLGACIAIGWGLSVLKSIREPLRGNYMSRRVLKAGGIAAAGCAIALLVAFLSFTAIDGGASNYKGFSVYLVFANIAMLAASSVGLYAASELRDPEAPKDARAAEELNTPMPVKVLFQRAFSYCGRHYGALIVLMLGLVTIGRALYVVVMSQWHTSLLVEEQSLLDWISRNNFIFGLEIPGDIASRGQLLYNTQPVFEYFQEVFKSSFYYAALGIAITIIIKSYQGGENTSLSAAMKHARSRFGPLVLVTVLFTMVYDLGLRLLFIPGLIIYTYCIFAFPNLLHVGKYKVLQNFGEAKNRVSGNFARSIMYGSIIYFMQFGFQLILQFLIEGVIQGVGGMGVVKGWRMNPYENIGNLVLLEFLTGGLAAFLAPLEASIIAMLFFDLAARKRAKVVESMKSPSAKARVQSLSSSSLVDRTQKARYCPRCGLSVRKGITRCPNCKAEVPAGG
ncbi:MAG: zinc ribbon domain-containing protein [Candidatus Lokiarchaeota archaeon]|nr:zinc ribbon domain-containing protein [Candidatus Lokiarchaeota archaeon]